MQDSASLYINLINHEKSAYTFLYKEVFPNILIFIKSNRGNSDDAKDIFHDALISMWNNMDTGKYTHVNDNSLMKYLITLCKFKWLDHLKSAGFRKTAVLDESLDVETIDSSQLMSDEEIKLRRTLFAELNAACQELLSLFYMKSLSMAAIADLKGWKIETAKNNKYRCMEKMKTIIKANQLKFK